MSRVAELTKEVATLVQMEKDMRAYIGVLREEQQEIKNLMIRIESDAMREGQSQISLNQRFADYFEVYSRKIQNLEDVATDLLSIKKTVEDLLKEEQRKAFLGGI